MEDPFDDDGVDDVRTSRDLAEVGAAVNACLELEMS
jgi:hypothetical protein